MMKTEEPEYTMRYRSPVGDIFLTASGDALTGLWFEGQKTRQTAKTVPLRELSVTAERELPVFRETAAYLDAYFAGKAPSCAGIPLAPEGSAFQKRVWRRLLQIPYGETVTYGQIAGEIAKEKGGAMSAQAVGGAVGRNRIGILIPCHRVVGADGSLTGYAGGLDKKVFLLRLEGIRVEDSRII